MSNVVSLREPRMPPANSEAEQCLLAAVLSNNYAYDKVAGLLQAEHFADGLHRRIYGACAKLIEGGKQANAVTVASHLDSEEDRQYLRDLAGAYVNIIDVRQYGQMIREMALRRAVIDLAEDMAADAYRDDLDLTAEARIEDAQERLFSLVETGSAETGLRPLDEGMAAYLEAAEAAYKRGDGLAGKSTGLADLDKILGGLVAQDLVILAGRPSMGKTGLATDIAVNVADLGEGAVAFFSLEMSREQLAGRILSGLSGIPSDKLRNGRFTEEQFATATEARRRLAGLPLVIDETPAITPAVLRTRARRLKRQQGLSLIVVDYLQLMQPPGGRPSGNRVNDVSEITRALKATAKELDVPLLALSQLSRAVEQREDKRPQLADLRDSGSIEQDADEVLFLFREEYYLERAEPQRRENEESEKYDARHLAWSSRLQACQNIAECIVAKNRHGALGRPLLHFDNERVTFSNLEREWTAGGLR